MSATDSIRAHGPWILVKPEPEPEKSAGGVYLPAGNLMERLGHTVAVVLSAGKGHYTEKNKKSVFVPMEVQKGDRVVFRGHMKKANQVGIRGGRCFMHQGDIVGILEKGASLELALPYDN